MELWVWMQLGLEICVYFELTAWSTLPDLCPPRWLPVSLHWLHHNIKTDHSLTPIWAKYLLIFLADWSSYQWTAEGHITLGFSCDLTLAWTAMVRLHVHRVGILHIQEPSSLWGSWLLVEDDILLWVWFFKDSEADGCKSQKNMLIPEVTRLCVLYFMYCRRPIWKLRQPGIFDHQESKSVNIKSNKNLIKISQRHLCQLVPCMELGFESCWRFFFFFFCFFRELLSCFRLTLVRFWHHKYLIKFTQQEHFAMFTKNIKVWGKNAHFHNV